MANRFEGCSALWKDVFNELEDGRVVWYARAVIKTRDGELYYVLAKTGQGDEEHEPVWEALVKKVEEFDERTNKVTTRKGFVSITLEERDYLIKLLLEERDGHGQMD